MLIRLTTLFHFKASNGEDHLPIVEGLWDPRTGALRFLVLDIGNWLSEVDVLIATREMGEIDAEAKEWRTSLTHDAIEEAPRWTDRGHEMRGLALENWPPVIVGPFGSTYSPLLLEAQLFGHEEAPTARISKVQDLDTISEWLRLPAFGEDGELGRVEDFVLDTETRVMSHVILERGHLFSKDHFVLPFETLRYRAEGHTHAVFDIDSAGLDKADRPDSLELAG